MICMKHVEAHRAWTAAAEKHEQILYAMRILVLNFLISNVPTEIV